MSTERVVTVKFGETFTVAMLLQMMVELDIPPTVEVAVFTDSQVAQEVREAVYDSQTKKLTLMG